MTDTTTGDVTHAREHADQSWRAFAREKNLTDTLPLWEEGRTPDGSRLLSGRLTGVRVRYALSRFARDYFLVLGPADVQPQFDIDQPGRTVLVWRRHGVWVELWHPDTAVDDPQPVTPVQGAPVPSEAVAAPAGPAPRPSGLLALLHRPSGRLPYTRKSRTTNPKESTV